MKTPCLIQNLKNLIVNSLIFLLILLNGFVSNTNAQSNINFTANPKEGCAPLTVEFINTSSAGSSYKWNFGDSILYSVFDTTYTFSTSGTYLVTLYAFNGAGNEIGNITDTIFVGGGDPVDFYADKDSACPGEMISFYSWAWADTLFWDFGDGSKDSMTSWTQHSYSDTGLFKVSFSINTICGLETAFKDIYISEAVKPKVFISADPLLSCPGDSINFYTWLSSDKDSVKWDLGDGTISTDSYIQHGYSDTGTYIVKLTVTNICGNSSTDSVTVTISNTVLPDVFLNASPNPVCPGSLVNFYSYQGAAFIWDFGDGNSGSGAETSHAYPNEGSYNVVLTVSNSCGNSKSDSITIDVIIDPQNLPYPQFDYYPYSACPGEDINFENYSWNADYVIWDFGDGTSSTQWSPMHSYSDTGIYDVTLTAVNGCGQEVYVNSIMIGNSAPEAYIAHWPDSVCASDTVYFIDYYVWDTIQYVYTFDFGDGTQAISSEFVNDFFIAKHSYSTNGIFNVSVKVENSCGGVAFLEDSVKVTGNIYPEAYAFTDFYNGDSLQYSCPGDTINFIAYGGIDYIWDFGDSSKSALKSPQHLYQDTGNYTISMIAINGCGYSDTAVLQLDINYDNLPAANFDFYNPNNYLCPGNVVNFENYSTSYKTLLWNFGDGSFSDENNPQHAYTASGNYLTTLIAQNGCGNDTLSYPVTVENKPTSNFTIADTGILSPAQVITFVNNSVDALFYFWDFGDGIGYSTDQNPTYSYSATGSYIVALNSINSYGCENTITMDLNIGIKASILSLNSTGTSAVIYPNPSKESFHVSFFTLENENISISIFDVLGNRIYTTNMLNSAGLQQLTFNKGELNLANGVYWIKLDFKNNAEFQKVVLIGDN